MSDARKEPATEGPARREPSQEPAPQEPATERSHYESATPPPARNNEAPAGTDDRWAPAPDRSGNKTAGIGVVAALAIGALVGGAAGAGVGIWAVSSNVQSPVTFNSGPSDITINDPDDVNAITAVAANASPSVVTISAVGADAAGSGSGVVLSEDGYIVTNTHVVTLGGASADAAIRVQTSDGRLLDATIVGTDPIFDLAVIKVDGVDDLQPAEFADSSDLNVGDVAIAVGAPLGLAGTVTIGIVSALNRSITVASAAVPEEVGGNGQVPDEGDEAPYDFWEFDVPGRETQPAPPTSSTISLAVIQTDAAINPGNSGGALLNSAGEVIGINVAIATAGGSQGGGSGSIGVGFAIPSNIAERVARELIEDGQASHGLLGATIANVTEDPAQTDPSTVGASIVGLTSGGAAEQAGLQVGDIIVAVNDVPIRTKTDLTAQVRALPGGADTEITYVRDGVREQVTLTLGEL